MVCGLRTNLNEASVLPVDGEKATTGNDVNRNEKLFTPYA